MCLQGRLLLVIPTIKEAFDRPDGDGWLAGVAAIHSECESLFKGNTGILLRGRTV
jgi:hypothetical protein